MKNIHRKTPAKYSKHLFSRISRDGCLSCTLVFTWAYFFSAAWRCFYSSIILPEPISAYSFISYRNQSFDLNKKLNDWFLYETKHWAKMGQNASKALENAVRSFWHCCRLKNEFLYKSLLWPLLILYHQFYCLLSQEYYS